MAESIRWSVQNVLSDIPLGGLEGFPADTFSIVLHNSFMRPETDILSHPLPKCGLHPRQLLSDYCKECSVQVCKVCCQGNDHRHQVGIQSYNATSSMQYNQLLVL